MKRCIEYDTLVTEDEGMQTDTEPHVTPTDLPQDDEIAEDPPRDPHMNQYSGRWCHVWFHGWCMIMFGTFWTPTRFEWNTDEGQWLPAWWKHVLRGHHDPEHEDEDMDTQDTTTPETLDLPPDYVVIEDDDYGHLYQHAGRWCHLHHHGWCMVYFGCLWSPVRFEWNTAEEQWVPAWWARVRRFYP